MTAQGDFQETAKTALEISARIRRDLSEIRTALMGRDEAKALTLMRKFFKLPDEDVMSDESEHYDNRKQPTRESPKGRRFVS